MLVVIFSVQASASRVLLQVPSPPPPPVCLNPPPQQINTTVFGFFFGSNAAGYDLLALDAVDIAAALDTSSPDFATAKSIYELGKNSRNARCAPKTLRQWATSKGYVTNNQNFWGLYNATFSPTAGETFQDTWVYEALNGTGPLASASPIARAAYLKAVTRSSLMTVYTFNEVDAAWNKTQLGNLVPAPGGASHNLDEGFAIWIGPGDQHSWGSPDGMAIEAGLAAGTGTATSSRAGNLAIDAFKGMQAAIWANSSDVANIYASYRQDLIKQVVVIHSQMVLKFASDIATADAATGGTVLGQSNALGYFRTITPLVANVSSTAVSQVLSALNFGGSPATDVVRKIQNAMAPVYSAYGITDKDMGKFAAGPPQTCSYKGNFRLKSVSCPNLLISTVLNCASNAVNLRKSSVAVGDRSVWKFNQEGEAFDAVTSVRICPNTVLAPTAVPSLAASGRFKASPVTAGDCKTVTLIAEKATSMGAYLSANKACTGLTWSTSGTSSQAKFTIFSA